MWIAEQPLRTGGSSRFVWTSALEQVFASVDRFGTPYNYGVRDGKWFEVPRGACPIGVDDQRVRYPTPAINCKIELRDDQPKCVTDAISWLKAGKNMVLEAPTGWGKCYAGTAIACALGQPTLIIVTKNDLKDNWIASIQVLRDGDH
jgi:hypothetical protein